MIRLLIHGAGRMANRLLARLPDFSDYNLLGVISISESEDIPSVDCYRSLEDLSSEVDLLIDFTLPGGPQLAADWCQRHGVALLSGTTALTALDSAALEKAALKVPVLWAANLSFGIALINSLVRQAASALGPDADVHVSETHHVHKLDAPSGTALALAASVSKGSGGDADEVGFTSLREGEVVGEHTVRFEAGDEVIEISHEALDRDIFATGALKAGQWLVQQAPGTYTTRDWLGLE